MSEEIRKMIDKVKNFKQFVNEQQLNEISSELRNNAISSMKIKVWINVLKNGHNFMLIEI